MCRSFVWLLVVSSVAIAVGIGRADVVNGPGRVFSLVLPGQWSVVTESDEAVAWSGKGQEDKVLHVIAARAELDANKPFGPQLIEAAKADEDLPNARDFVEADVRILERDTALVAFAFDGEGGAATQGCGAAFAVGQCVYLVVVIGEPSPFTWADARAILGSVGPPSDNAAATGGDQQAARPLLGVAPIAEGATGEGLPEGWLWKQALNGSAVQVFQKAQPGAVAEMVVLAHDGRSASALLRDGFYKPLADRLQVTGVSQAEDDSVAAMQYTREVGGVALKGEALVQVRQGVGLVANIAGHAEKFTAEATKARQVLAGLAAGAGRPEPAVTPLPVPPLEQRFCADGSARISVPAGWQVAGTNGMIEAESPEGLHVSVGLHSQLADRTVAARLAAGGLDPALSGTVYMDYLPPEQAAPGLMTYISQAAGVLIENAELVSSAVLPNVPGFAAFEMKWREHLRDGRVQDRHAMGLVSTQPPLDGVWSYYMTLVSAPPGKLEAAMPLLVAVARSAGWTAQFNAETLGRIRADVNETADIIAGVAQRRSESTDTTGRMWGAAIRGDEGVINDATGERRLITGLDGMQRWMSEDPNLRLENLRPMNLDEWRTAGF